MDCWKFLGLEPNADAKSIKLAYSRLLKKIRPEDDPKHFQELREAYRIALESSSTAAISDGEKDRASLTGLSDVTIKKKYFDEPSDNLSQKPVKSASKAEIKLEKEFVEFIAEAKYLIEDPEKVNLRKEWIEILRSPVLVDLEYRNQACDRIFCLVADSYLDGKEKTELWMDVGVLTYLNSEFKWEENSYKLLHRFGSKRCNAVFDNLDEKDQDGSFRLVGIAGTVLMIVVILCGYYGIPFIPVLLVAAFLSSVKRLYTRYWQEKRYGLTNGGNAAFLKGNKISYLVLIYLSMCITEALFYGIGRLIRMITS